MSVLSIEAYAKLNLTMEVLGKRPDGYHNIRSIMQFVSIGDRVELSAAPDFSFWCDDSALANDDNLCVRAYRLLASHYPVPPLAIRLCKRVPYMSGLGGGSADCAAVLRGINTLCGLGIVPERLLTLGRALGADVPPCLVGGTLLAEGIGEIITPIPQTTPLWFDIIKPDAAFSTPEMYRRMDEAGGFAPARSQEPLLTAVAAGDPAGIVPWLCNSFEPVAEPPEVITGAKRLLTQSGALGAAMTGAGSAVFGLYADEQSARAGCDIISATGARVYCCHSKKGIELCLD